jgi:hypothetical protein
MAVSKSETSVSFYEATRRNNNPGDSHLQAVFKYVTEFKGKKINFGCQEFTKIQCNETISCDLGFCQLVTYEI